MRPSESQVRSAITPRRVGSSFEPRDRHDREDLVDRPDIGHRFEHREVDEVLVDQLLVQIVQRLAMRALSRQQARAHGIGDGVEQLVQARAIVQVQLAEREQGLAFGEVVLGLMEEFQRRPLVELGMGFAQVAQHRGLVIAGRRDGAGRHRLDLADIHDHHRVVRRHRASGLGEHAPAPAGYARRPPRRAAGRRWRRTARGCS